MMSFNGKANWRERSSHAKCYISEEHLNDLEKKVKEVSQALNLLKEGMASNMTSHKVFPGLRFLRTKEEHQEHLQV